MIEEMKEITITICFSMVSLGYLTILSPNDRLNKLFRFFVNIFFITVVLAPFLSISKFESIPLKEVQSSHAGVYQQKVSTQIEEEINQQIRNTLTFMIQKELERKKLPTPKMKFFFSYDQKSQLEVGEIQIFIKEEDPKEEIITTIQRVVDCKVTVIYVK